MSTFTLSSLVYTCLLAPLVVSAQTFDLEGGGRWRKDPLWTHNPNWESPSLNPIQDVKFLGFVKDRNLRVQVKQAMTDQASASKVLSEVLLNVFGNETTGAMLDKVFCGAFSKAPDKAANVQLVQQRFAAAAQGLTIKPDEPDLIHPTRVVNLSDDEAEAVFGPGWEDQNMFAAPEHATIFLTRHSLQHGFDGDKVLSVNFRRRICSGTNLTKRLLLASVMGHESMHLAGVNAKPDKEVYIQKDMLSLPYQKALENASNYQLAILYQLSGCIDKLFTAKNVPDGIPNDNPNVDEVEVVTEHGYEMRKLLKAQFPDGDKANTTDLTQADQVIERPEEGPPLQKLPQEAYDRLNISKVDGDSEE